MPVYISYEAYETGDAPTEEKKEWQRIYHEANAKLKRSGTVHVYILAPKDGEVIESIDIGTATQPEKLLARLKAVIEKLRTAAGAPLVKPSPQSHPPKAARGSLVLHLAARSYKGTWNEFPVENWFVLSRTETAKLLPAGDVMVGKSWELDKDLSSTFLVKFLPNGYVYASHHKTQIMKQELRATVVSVARGVANARIHGTLKLKHKSLNFNVSPPADTEDIAEMHVEGFIDFEPTKQEVRTMCLLADKASARRGEVEYAVALRSVAPEESKPEPKPKAKAALLFDFEEQADLKAWSNLELPDRKQKEPLAGSSGNTTGGDGGRRPSAMRCSSSSTHSGGTLGNF